MQGKHIDDKRNYGIDALRIFAMYMIVIIHLLNKGKVLNWEYSSLAMLTNTFLYSMVLCCVNCYALISGYVGYKIDSKYNFTSYINLWFQVVFYGIVIVFILKATGLVEVHIKDFLEALLPVTRNQYWYFTAYTGIFFVAPIINKAVECMQVKSMKIICLVIIFVFSFYGTVAQNLGGDPFGLEEGYSFVWLLLMYMLGASIKRNQWDQKILEHKYSKRNLVLISVGCVMITFCWYFIVERLSVMILGKAWGMRMLMSYISPAVLCLSVCLLVLFSGLKIKNQAVTLVRFCAQATFGVYLIHMQPLIAKHVLSTSFTWIAGLQGVFPTIVVFLISFLILLLCIIIDRLRMLIFKVCRINKMAEKINEICWKILGQL